MKSLFVMDPLDRIHVSGDSTYVTMRECTDRGYRVHMCTPPDLYALNGAARCRAVPVRTTATAPFFHPGDPEDLGLADFDVVWMRKDPPFDMDYIFTTYLLDMAPPSTLVVNGSAGLKLFNEKMWVIAEWPHLHPETLVSRDLQAIVAFVNRLGGRAVLKPWDGNGGRGVLVTHPGDRNLQSMVEVLTGEGRQYVIAQAFIEGVDRGDKRILLFEGQPVGAILRVPTEGDYRANMHVGARVERCELDARDHQICAELRPLLLKWGMVFVGIDVIDGYLTEVNVTSPTGIREVNQLMGTKLERDLVDCVEARLQRERA